MRSKLISVFGFVAIFLATSPTSGAGDPNEMPKSIPREARESWAHLREHLRRSLEVSIDASHGNQGKSFDAVEFKGDYFGQVTQKIYFQNNNASIIDLRAGKTCDALCVNGVYACRLRRQSPQTASWTVTNLIKSPDEVKSSKAIARGIAPETAMVFAGLMVECVWLSEIVDHPTFVIQSIQLEKDLCRIKFVTKHPIDSVNTILGGELVLDPKKSWVITSYRVDEKSTDIGTVTGNLQYQDFLGYPFPKQCVVDYVFENDTPMRYVYEYDSPAIFEGSEDRFRLTSFGLPEPGIRSENRSSTWIFINLLAIALLVFGIILRRKFGQSDAPN